MKSTINCFLLSFLFTLVTSQVLPVPGDCTKYQICDYSGCFVFNCGPGTEFNPRVYVCDYPLRDRAPCGSFGDLGLLSPNAQQPGYPPAQLPGNPAGQRPAYPGGNQGPSNPGYQGGAGNPGYQGGGGGGNPGYQGGGGGGGGGGRGGGGQGHNGGYSGNSITNGC